MRKSENNRTKKGISILGVLVFGVVILLVLSYFNISIRAVVESPAGQENVNYVSRTGKNLWDNYLEKPVSYLWNDIWLNLFWKPFIYNMERIRDDKPTDLEESAPTVNL